jgi:hypothetical protein
LLSGFHKGGAPPFFFAASRRFLSPGATEGCSERECAGFRAHEFCSPHRITSRFWLWRILEKSQKQAAKSPLSIE